MALRHADLKRVRKLLLEVKSKWYDIGLELDIDPDTLDDIKDKFKDNHQDCLTEMLKVWLKSTNPKPTWTALGDALKDEAVDEVELAKKGLQVQ